MADETENTQNSQVLSFTRTSETAELADLVGIMADEIKRELSTAQGAGRTTQGAGGMGPAHGQAQPEAAQGVQMAQNTQELSLTTPVLFYGKCNDGKRIPPNTFLMELEARHTCHG
jgi:hypothetical protein